MERRVRPTLEGLEGRELLSVTAMLALEHPPIHLAATGGGSGTTTGVSGGPGITLKQGSPNQYLQPTGEPTAREQRKQRFTFRFSGAFVQTPGRYSDEATFVRVVGVGSSTYFLHGDVQLNAIVPTDPTRETSGTSVSFDRNINSNSTFGFDLTGSTADVDKANRPTVFTGATDVNISSGVFVESSSNATVTIHYFPDGKPHPKGHSAGRATVLIQGSAYTLGTGNILAGAISINNTNRPSQVVV